MTKLDEIIKRTCPNGVEFKKLKDFCDIKTGKGIVSKNTTTNGNYPVISGGTEPMGFYHEFNRNENTITIARAGSAGYVDFIKTKFYLNDKCFSVIPRDKTNVKYLYYFLKNNEHKIIDLKSKGSVPTVNTEKIGNLEVAIPDKEAQCEIVRILDNFAELTAELTAELSFRKSQYEFYKEKLIDQSNFPMKKIGDIALEMFRGSGIKREHVLEKGIPCIRYGEIYTIYGNHFKRCISHTRKEFVNNPKILKHGDILFAITGESVEEIGKSTAYIGNDEGYVGGDIAVLRHNQNPKYISYALSTKRAIIQKGIGKIKSKVVHTNIPSLKNILIPIPNIEIQDKIVNVLDQFDYYCNNLLSGLPAEIRYRQQQYEYYRDKLLSFNR